jgi:hypothetical protein
MHLLMRRGRQLCPLRLWIQCALATVLPAGCTPDEAQGSESARVQIEETEHDFGSVEEGEEAVHEFSISNVGLRPLAIEDVRTNCGCMVVTGFKSSVIPPGARSPSE